MNKLIFFAIFLMLVAGILLMGRQRNQSGIQQFTMDLEADKKRLLKERESKVASPEVRKEQLVARGWALIEKGEYRQARQVAREVLDKLDPDSEQAKSIISVANSALNRSY